MGANGTKQRAKDRYEGLEIATNNFGNCVVINYTDSYNIDVEFEDGTVITTNVKQIKEKSIKNPNKPVLFGFGFVGQGVYNHKNNADAYNHWYSMLERCYCPVYRELKPTYESCSCVKEWNNFQNFAGWFYTQVWYKGWELDKDLITPGNKLYSPDTCAFVPRRLNLLINHNKRGDKSNPIGVFWSEKRRKYCTQCRGVDGKISLSVYSDDIEYLENLYKTFKKSVLREVAREYEGIVDQRVLNSLSNWEF